LTDRDSCGTALRRLARFRDPVAIIAARMRLAFSAKQNSPNLVHSRFPKSSRYFCQSPERYRGAVLSGRKPSGRLQLAHLYGFVLGGRRDTGIAVNHAGIVHRKSASKKPNFIKGAAMMQISLETPNVGYLMQGRRSGSLSALAPKPSLKRQTRRLNR
jgi:hypothetical protein